MIRGAGAQTVLGGALVGACSMSSARACWRPQHRPSTVQVRDGWRSSIHAILPAHPPSVNGSSTSSPSHHNRLQTVSNCCQDARCHRALCAAAGSDGRSPLLCQPSASSSPGQAAEASGAAGRAADSGHRGYATGRRGAATRCGALHHATPAPRGAWQQEGPAGRWSGGPGRGSVPGGAADDGRSLICGAGGRRCSSGPGPGKWAAHRAGVLCR